MESPAAAWEAYSLAISGLSDESDVQAGIALQPVLLGATGYATALKANGEDLQSTKAAYISQGAAVTEQTCQTAGVTVKLS